MAFTRLSYLIVGFICILGILSQWVNHEALELLWRMVAAIFVLSLTLEGLLARYRPVGIKHDGPNKLQLGYPGQLEVHISNPGKRAIELQTQLQFSPQARGNEALQSLKVEPQTELKKNIPIVVTELQKQSMLTFYFRLLGHWKLAWWSRRPEISPEYEVEPKMLKHQDQGAGFREMGQKIMAKNAMSGRDLMLLREFQAQDPMRNVDWKATAKMGKPMVRVYAEEASMDLVIVLDAGRASQIQVGSLSRLHHFVNVAARLAELAIQHGDRVALMSSQKSYQTIPLNGGVAGLRQIRTHLQRLRSHSGEFNPLSAALQVNQMLKRRSLVVFFTEIEENDAATQLLKANKLLTPKHSPLIASLVDPTIDSLKSSEEQNWLAPYHSYAAYEFEHARDKTVLKLQHQGAQVILAKPEQLDGRVLKQYEWLRYRRRV